MDAPSRALWQGEDVSSWRRATAPTVILAIAVAYPLVIQGPYWQRLGALVLLGAIGASAWNIVGGYAGQISIGHALFYGIGAYAPLLLYTVFKTPLLVGIPAGVVCSVLVAFVIGRPTFRLRGHYFTMGTIAVAELTRLGFQNWAFVGGPNGLAGPVQGRAWWDLTFRGSTVYYYVFLFTLCLVLLVTHLLERARFGHYLRAIKDSERASRSLGIPVSRYKLYALMLSAAFTAVAGSFYGMMIGFVDPNSVFGILISVEMVIVATLGGSGRLFGPLIGALILIPLKQLTNAYMGSSGSGVSLLAYGVVIMALSAAEPNGLIGIWSNRHRIMRLLPGRRSGEAYER